MAQLRKEDKILRDKVKLRLRKLRNEQEESKTDVSKRIEVDRQNFQPWENLDSERGMSIYSINRVCEALGITLKEFFDDEIFQNE